MPTNKFKEFDNEISHMLENKKDEKDESILNEKTNV